MDLDTVADELYALPRKEFTSTRDERARRAREAGERELAAGIGRLRKPSTAAWLANLLARAQPAEVGGLVELGDALRDAHNELDGPALRRLSEQRYQLVTTLVTRARELGRSAGNPVSDAVARELEQTFTAALGDPDAARALAAGRLTTGLEPGGAAWPPGTRGAKPAEQPARREPDQRTRQRADETDRAQRDLEDAREAAAAAKDEVTDAQRALDRTKQRSDEAGRAVEELRAQLERAERDAENAAAEVRSMRRAHETVDQQAREAQQRMSDLERRFEALRDGTSSRR